MKHIYIKDADGRKVIVEVTDDVAVAYRESMREEWRGDAKERYHTISLGAVADAGHEFADENACIEDVLIREEDDAARHVLFKSCATHFNLLRPYRRRRYIRYMSYLCRSRRSHEKRGSQDKLFPSVLFVFISA